MAVRKDEAYKRTKAIEGFVNNSIDCRSKIIASYFGDNNVIDCGICDNCINNTEAKLKPADFKDASEKIISLVKKEKLTAGDLLKRMKPLRQRSVWLVISYLLAEEILFTNDENLIMLKANFKTP